MSTKSSLSLSIPSKKKTKLTFQPPLQPVLLLKSNAPDDVDYDGALNSSTFSVGIEPKLLGKKPNSLAQKTVSAATKPIPKKVGIVVATIRQKIKSQPTVADKAGSTKHKL